MKQLSAIVGIVLLWTLVICAICTIVGAWPVYFFWWEITQANGCLIGMLNTEKE